MMPGWASSGKPTFQADAESALAAEQAAKEQESVAAVDGPLRCRTSLYRIRCLC
jgi:hypothetical protein